MSVPIKTGDIIFSRVRGYSYIVVLGVYPETETFRVLRHDDATGGGKPTTSLILCHPVDKTLMTRAGWEKAGWKLLSH